MMVAIKHTCRQFISALCVPQNLCLPCQRHADIQDTSNELAGSPLYHIKEKGISPTFPASPSFKNTSKDTILIVLLSY